MNLSQRQDVLNAIENILSKNLDSALTNARTGVDNISTLQFGDYPYAEFKAMLERMLHQLKNELQNGFGLFLPIQETFNNEYQVVALDKDIAQLNTLLFSNRPNRPNIQNSHLQIATLLQKLVYYQIVHGFWDRSSVKKHDVDSEAIEAVKIKVELGATQLEKSLAKFAEQQSLLSLKMQEIDSFIGNISNRAEELGSFLTKAKDTEIGITEVRASCLIKAEEINSTAKAIFEKQIEITGDISSYRTEHEKLKADISSVQLESTKLNAVTKELNDGALTDAASINAQKSEILRLVGMAADGSLGYKFAERKKELNSTVNWWILGVFGTSLLAVTWAVIVFVCLEAKAGNLYIDLLVNLVKTSPGFILMGFVLKQYTKERNLQEEYAFKSAVAMTLTSYSGMLEQKDVESNKSRQDMLLKSIAQVYSKPKSHIEKVEKPISINTKDLTDSVKALTEVVKEIKK